MTEKTKNIIVKYCTKQASLEELDMLSSWVEDDLNKEEFIKFLKINYAIDFNLKKFDLSSSKSNLLDLIEQDKKTRNLKITMNVLKYAAVIFLMLGLGHFYNEQLLKNKQDSIEIQNIVDTKINSNIIPGSERATLTLEDGTQVELEKGKLVQTKNITSNGEKLEYNSTKKNSIEVGYNYLTIPRGGQFHLKLADGTLVWLNSETQLKYPVAFIDGQNREVELVYGEAYFEVSPSTEHNGATFKVLNPSQEIEVLGTEFNVKAYKDETNIYTTLVNGRVVINTPNLKQILRPNQQSNLNVLNNQISIEPANVYNEISWKNGLFSFKGKSLVEIAKVLSRWYDVDIEFANVELEDTKFNGVLNKEEAIEEILNSILITNTINAYEIKNKKITIK